MWHSRSRPRGNRGQGGAQPQAGFEGSVPCLGPPSVGSVGPAGSQGGGHTVLSAPPHDVPTEPLLQEARPRGRKAGWRLWMPCLGGGPAWCQGTLATSPPDSRPGHVPWLISVPGEATCQVARVSLTPSPLTVKTGWLVPHLARDAQRLEHQPALTFLLGDGLRSTSMDSTLSDRETRAGPVPMDGETSGTHAYTHTHVYMHTNAHSPGRRHPRRSRPSQNASPSSRWVEPHTPRPAPRELLAPPSTGPPAAARKAPWSCGRPGMGEHTSAHTFPAGGAHGRPLLTHWPTGCGETLGSPAGAQAKLARKTLPGWVRAHTLPPVHCYVQRRGRDNSPVQPGSRGHPAHHRSHGDRSRGHGGPVEGRGSRDGRCTHLSEADASGGRHEGCAAGAERRSPALGQRPRQRSPPSSPPGATSLT